MVLRVEAVFSMKKPVQPHTGSTHQTVLKINTADSTQSIRIGFTDQRLTAYGGRAFWSAFLHKRKVRAQLKSFLPHQPISPNAYDPSDVALGLMGGVLCGADKLSRVAYLRGDPAIVSQLLDRLPKHIRVGCVRADAGFYHEKVLKMLEQRELHSIIVMRLYLKWQKYCRHEDSAWTPTDVAGIDAQEIEGAVLGRRIIILRHQLSERPDAGGKALLCLPGYRFQALVTNLPASWSVLSVWRRYNGRGESENRIKELGSQFGIKGLCCKKFWATQAACQLAIWAYNLCVLLQRELGLLEKVQLQTLRWRLFYRAGIWSRAQGKPMLKLAVRGQNQRQWWTKVAEKLRNTLPPLNCDAVEWVKV